MIDLPPETQQHRPRGRGRLVALGRRTDNDKRCTLLVVTARLVQVGVRSPSRQAALNTLVTEIPAPLLAEALGYHPKTVTLRAGELGTDWASYAASKARSSTSRE